MYIVTYEVSTKMCIFMNEARIISSKKLYYALACYTFYHHMTGHSLASMKPFSVVLKEHVVLH